MRFAQIACAGVTAFVFLVTGTSVSQAAEPAVTISFRGTANESGLGYTAGDLVTFTFTLNPAFVDTGDSTFTDSFQNWLVTSVGEPGTPPVFSNISGTGITGNYIPGTPDLLAVSSLTNGSSGLLGADAENAGGLGLFAGGVELGRIYLEISLFADEVNFAFPGSYTSPAAYFANYPGDYAIDSSSPFSVFTIRSADSSTTVTFTPTSAEIAAVPEPAATAVIFSLALAGLALWSRHRRRSGKCA